MEGFHNASAVHSVDLHQASAKDFQAQRIALPQHRVLAPPHMVTADRAGADWMTGPHHETSPRNERRPSTSGAQKLSETPWHKGNSSSEDEASHEA